MIVNSLKESFEKTFAVKGRWIVLLIFLLMFSFYKNIVISKAKSNISDQAKFLERDVVEKAKEINDIKRDYLELKFRTRILTFKGQLLNYRHPRESKIVELAIRKGEEYNVSAWLVLAVIQTESNFNSRARSRIGALGLMQINYPVWRKELGIKNEEELYNMGVNIDLGIKILKGYIDEAGGDVLRGLHLYNNGYLGTNVAYSREVMERLAKLKSGMLQ